MKKSFKEFRNEKTIMNAQQYEEEYGAYIVGEFAWVYEDGLHITINMDGTFTLILDRLSYSNNNLTLEDLEKILYDYACDYLWESSQDFTTKCIEEAFKTINFNFNPSSFEFGEALREFGNMVHEETYHFLCRKWMQEAGFHNISLDNINQNMLIEKFGDDWECKLIEQLLLIRLQDFLC